MRGVFCDQDIVTMNFDDDELYVREIRARKKLPKRYLLR
jgi:hypothetical protein